MKNYSFVKAALCLLALFYVHFLTPMSLGTTPVDPNSIVALTWDPGLTHEGTRVYTNTTTGPTNLYFRVTTANPSLGAWRTALKVHSGEAHLYLSRGVTPTPTLADFKSERVGSDGFVLSSAQFAPNEVWYILVRAQANTSFTLVSGAPYVQDLGTVAADDSSSSGEVIVGPEGMRFFSARVPTDMLAWRLWLNGATNNILLKKTSVPLPNGGNELSQNGQALVVPPYLAGGQQYFIAVVGNPGTTNRLDSRQQPIINLNYGSNATNEVTGFPYTTYRIQVPPQQIAWRVSIPATQGNPNLSVRRNMVPNENNNDALSELAPALTDNIALVPPVLSDGTFYVTVWATNAHRFTLQNGPAVVTDINYIDSVVNDDPDRVGWRYYRVANINQQLGSLGWHLSVSNAAPGTRIAIRRNAAPGIWNLRNPGARTENFHDFISFAENLQHPGHQADVWYVGVYNPTNALANFTLTAKELDPGPLLQPWQTVEISRTNVAPGVWEYFRLDLPEGPHPGLGWDLRLKGVTGYPILVVRRDAFPDTQSSGFGAPVNATNWASRTQWAAAADWTGRSLPNVGTTNENGRILTMALGRPLQPGRYYIGVQSATQYPQPISFTLSSRWIGENLGIPLSPLAWTGDRQTNTVTPREANYYAVEVPTGRRSLKMRLRMLTGEAMLVASKDTIPNISASPNISLVGTAGKSVQKERDEYLTILPPRGTNVLTPGTYYIAVVGEGQAPPDNTRIGTGESTYVLETFGEIPEPNLGLLETELATTGSLAGGDLQAFHFNTPPGILGFWVFLENREGNPVVVSSPGGNLADPGLGSGSQAPDLYGNDGGEQAGATAGIIISVSDPFETETIMVKARKSGPGYPDANYTLRVKKIDPEPLSFDGGIKNVTNGDPQQGNYFYIDVPADAIGWDLRITNVTSGMPRLAVRRDFLPTTLSSSAGFNPAKDTRWPPLVQWAPGRDWTDRPLSPEAINEDGRIMAVGMGKPLEPGRYYVVVLGNSAEAMNYTIVSRGIGEGMSIPITPLAYNGGTLSVSGLAPREAAYFSVDVPAGVPSWKVRMNAVSGEALMIASAGTAPNIALGVGLNMTNSAGHKMQKTGDEHFLLLPPSGTNTVTPGRYYLAVVGEGQDPTLTQVGGGTTAFTITSLGTAPVKQLGEIGLTDLVETNSLAAGDTQIYQFTVPTGTLGVGARLDDRSGHPVMVLTGGPRAPYPGAGLGNLPIDSYGNENGEAQVDVHPTLINVGAATNTIYTLVVMARHVNLVYSNATYTLRLNASGTTPLGFDGESHSVTGQGPKTWKYFRINVPETANGWDVRLLDVTNGVPRIVVRRASLPSSLATTGWSSPGTATSWPTNAQWAPTTDWTRRTHSATNASLSEIGRVFAAGMGRPLEPGTYYVGVYNDDPVLSASYTILTRGIGPNLSIPLIDIPLTGSHSTTLPARDAAYFRVIVPSNSPSWKVKLTGDSGESMMVGLRGAIPNIDMNQVGGTLANGKGMQKPGNEHFVLLPGTGLTNVLASTNYFAVISEGVNPPSSSRIGLGSSSFTFESEGVLPTADLGMLTSSDILQPDIVEGGEVRRYRFLVPSGTLGFNVRLENRVGNPTFVLLYGDKTPDPGGTVSPNDPYGNEGGQASTDGNSTLLSVPNPAPGIYTLVVKGRPINSNYPDASYTLRLQEILVPEINFGADQNTNGLSNAVSGILEDNERIFFKFNIPATNAGQPVIGWKLDLVQSSGLASMRVRRDSLPADINSGSLMQFTTAAAIIVPPYLTNGIWFVEVKGAGSTAFTLTSSPLLLERPAWNMPAPGEPVPAPGVTFPLFGDSGINTNGVPLPGDSSTFLEQGSLHHYAVNVPTNNTGVLRAVLEAVSGNPDIYLRYGAPPTLYHSPQGANGNIYDRSMLATATEYANWVPMDGKLESNLKPGLWYIAVRAAGNANARYRLKLSVGNITEIPVHGPALSNQLLAGGDWRYYKFTAPSTLPGGLSLTFSKESGDVAVHVRDTVPPGNGNTGSSGQYKDWTSDNKNTGPYPSFTTQGTYSLDAPPLRPGATYYFGVRAVADSIFTIRATTNGAPNLSLPTIAFYGGTAITNLPPGGQTLYRIDVPIEATRWKHAATHALGVQFSLEQGTLPKAGSEDWKTGSSANHTFNQYLLSSWPWVAGQSYFLMISNSTAQAQEIVFSMDGKNAQSDDNDNDALPDAWELQYFGNTGSHVAAGDPDKDGVTNYDEFLEGTNPNDAGSYLARLFTAAQFGTIVRSPDAPSFPLNSQVTLTATPAAGYAFIGWTGGASGSANPLVVTMDGHKTIAAIFRLAGDDFVTALPLSGASANVTASNVGMSKETGEPNHAGNPGGKSIWWRWTAPASGDVTVTTAGTAFNTLLGVYTGSAVSTLTRIASDNNSGGLTNRSVVNFNAVAGTTYNIAVDGYNGASSRISLSLTQGGGGGNTPPELGLVVLNGKPVIAIFGDPNRSYNLQRSADLNTWSPVGSVTTDGTGEATYTDNTASGNHLFYRTSQ